jgi:hypothetical protein
MNDPKKQLMMGYFPLNMISQYILKGTSFPLIKFMKMLLG